MSRRLLLLVLILGVVLAVGAWYYGHVQQQRAEESATSTPPGTSAMAAAPVFTTVHESRRSKENYCNFDISYPQAHIEGNADLEAWLNTYLKVQFVPSEAQLADCESSVKDITTEPIVQTTTVSYNVKLSSGDLVSLMDIESSYFEGAAHPNNNIQAFTIDLANRAVVSYGSLLQPGSAKAVNELVYAAVADAFAAEGEDPYFTKADFLADYAKDNYDFYLTGDSLVIVNLFDVHALQGIEAKVPLFKLKPYLNPHGVLMRLVSQDA